MSLPEIFEIDKLHIDPPTAALTGLIFSLILWLRKKVIKLFKIWGEYFINGILFIADENIKHSMAAVLSMKRYCKMLYNNPQLQYLSVPAGRDISLHIDKIFVNLTINYIDQTSHFLNHDTLLKVGNRIMVMGDPGSGKSSLIKRMLRNACHLGLDEPGKKMLPVIIELKNIKPELARKENPGKWLFDYIKQEVSRYAVYKMDECIYNYAVTTGILVLMDGLDEVASSNYNQVAECINAFSSYLEKLSPNNTIVLTMRTQFYQQVKNDFSKKFPHSAFLMPFTPADIYKFLSKWHFSKESERNIARIYKELTDRPTLREMCSNPLTLSMYVAEDQISGGKDSPESRTAFYKKVTDELVIKRRSAQAVEMYGSITVLKEQREKILGKIAYNHLMDVNEPMNSIDYNAAIDVIQQVVFCDRERAVAVFNEIAKETGLINMERDQESFRFIHLTFCEFLAAFESIQGIENGWEELISSYHQFSNMSVDARTRLIEVIPFAAGLLPRVKREKALRDIYALGDRQLTARSFLETKYYSHELWKSFIVEAREELLERAEFNFDEPWIRDLQLFNVVVRDAKYAADQIYVSHLVDLNSFYKGLIEEKKVSLHSILSSFASQDAAALFRLSELCNIDLLQDFPDIIIQNCFQQPFLGLIKDRIKYGNHDSERWVVLIAEAALRHSYIAELLDNTSHDDVLEQRIKQNKQAKIWYYRNYITKSFLTQCISLSSLANLNLNSQDNCLNDLFLLKAPHERRIELRFRSILPYIIITLALPCLYLITLRLIGYLNIGAGLFYLFFIACFNLLTLGGLYFMLSICHPLAEVYKVALNLKFSFPEDEDLSFLQKYTLFMAFKTISNKDKQILKKLLRNRFRERSEKMPVWLN